ncbi:MAG: VIT1/CCC1 transporter family protein [Alphaproteobacteria bacterium]|nr:VIT1/CCC1 transporter family protein [Alphaproteobacteria bacterium]
MDSNNWRDERNGAFLLRRLSRVEGDKAKAELFAKLAEESEAQAKLMVGGTEPAFSPSLRARIVAGLTGWFGVKAMRPALAAMKVRGLSVYNGAIVSAAHPTPAEPSKLESHHRSAGGGSLRAAVFGVNDGLVSNTCLILGVAGAAESTGFILTSGIAGLLAGAFAMAAGEFISVRSQREMFEHQISLERSEIENHPEAEAEELALIYAARGVPLDDARKISTALVKNKEEALNTLAREELGLNPEDLGSPLGAAFWSFVSFAFGAVLPLAPFALHLANALYVAVAVAGVALFVIGGALSLFSGRNAIMGGLRMVLIGAIAAAATYSIGKLFGVGVA